MKRKWVYTFVRLKSILTKELVHIRRDFITYGMLILSPLLQVVLFGYIINHDPKYLPTYVIAQDHSIFSRDLIYGLANTKYFDIKNPNVTESEAEQALENGSVLFVLSIPTDFSKDLIQEKQPHVLLEVDGADPAAVSGAIDAAKMVGQTLLDRHLIGPLEYLKNVKPPFFLDIQIKYNPGLIIQYHTLPGLLVVIISITLPLIAALSLTREYESGSIESLLITPVKPTDIIIGKIVPLIVLGYILVITVVLLSYFLFNVPFKGSVPLYLLLAFPFILANIGVGLIASTVSRTQLRAANVTNTYVLPATLLSGFLFPFYGMPYWAQVLGNIFPPAHFLRITSNIFLKGAPLTALWSDIWPILVFALIMFFIAIRNYRKRLD